VLPRALGGDPELGKVDRCEVGLIISMRSSTKRFAVLPTDRDASQFRSRSTGTDPDLALASTSASIAFLRSSSRTGRTPLGGF
jgi:hypothetical protein